MPRQRPQRRLRRLAQHLATAATTATSWPPPVLRGFPHCGEQRLTHPPLSILSQGFPTGHSIELNPDRGEPYILRGNHTLSLKFQSKNAKIMCNLRSARKEFFR